MRVRVRVRVRVHTYVRSVCNYLFAIFACFLEMEYYGGFLVIKTIHHHQYGAGEDNMGSKHHLSCTVLQTTEWHNVWRRINKRDGNREQDGGCNRLS